MKMFVKTIFFVAQDLEAKFLVIFLKPSLIFAGKASC